MELGNILANRRVTQPQTFSNTPIGHLGEHRVSEIVNSQQGLEITCRDCYSHFNHCEICGVYVCECEYHLNDPQWQGRTVHSRPNPFGTPENNADFEEGEIPMIHCSNCFEHREEFVIDFMMDDHGDIDIFYHENIQEIYEEFFIDTSGNNNTELYQTYQSYTFDEFREHITERFQTELREQFDMDEPIEEDLENEEEHISDIGLQNNLLNVNGEEAHDAPIDQLNQIQFSIREPTEILNMTPDISDTPILNDGEYPDIIDLFIENVVNPQINDLLMDDILEVLNSPANDGGDIAVN